MSGSPLAPVAPAPENDDLSSGQIVGGRYRVVGRLGGGGMGQVYEVEHIHLRRRFALKRLRGGRARRPGAIEQFRREAELIARLHHPNIVQVSDWDTLPDGSPCLIMELLQGTDLAERLSSRGPLDWTPLERIGTEVLSAIEAAHRAGIVHRDLKPANIFLIRDDSRREYAKLLDFGIAEALDRARHQASDTVLGTPNYMSPEQAGGRPSGPESDVWAMGAVLYHMTSGQMPFAGDDLDQVLDQILHGHPPPLAILRPDVPPPLADAIERSLSRDPRRRIVRAKDLRRLVREALAHLVTADDATHTEIMPLPAVDGAGPPSSAPTLPRHTQAVSPAAAPPARAAAPAVVSSAASSPGTPALDPESTTVIDHRVLPALRPARRRRLPAALVAAAIAIAGALVLLLVHAAGSRHRDRTDAPPPARPAAAPPAATATPADPPPAGPRPDAPAGPVDIRIIARPAGAELRLDGRPLDGTTVRIARDGRRHELRARAPGYSEAVLAIDASFAPEVRVELARSAAPHPSVHHGSGHHPSRHHPHHQAPALEPLPLH